MLIKLEVVLKQHREISCKLMNKKMILKEWERLVSRIKKMYNHLMI